MMGHKAVCPPAVLSSQFSSRLHLLLLFLLLLASSGLPRQIGDFTQCNSASFLPGYSLLGESLDVATYERKGVYPVDIQTVMFGKKRKCLLQENPHRGNRLQKVPRSVGLWTPETHCEHKIRGDAYSSGSSLIEKVKLKNIYNWKGVGGQYYDLYGFAKSRSGEDQYTFSLHWHRCSFYRLALKPRPLLNKDFKDDVKNLPRYYHSGTKDKYREFIRKYGTHYIHQATLGGQIQRVGATRMCLSRLNGISTEESRRCLSLDLQVGLGMGSLDYSCSKFLQNRGTRGHYSAGLYKQDTQVMGGNGWSGWVSSDHPNSEGYRQWKESLKRIPVIVEVFKKPLYDLVNTNARSGLMDAINEYIRDTTHITVSVRKPSCSLQSHYSDCCPKQLGKGWLTVTIVRGWDLYGDVVSVTDGYVKLSYGEQSRTTQTIQSNNPRWDETFNLGLVDVGQKLTLELKDEDLTSVETLFSCSRYVKGGSHTVTCHSDNKYGTFEAKYKVTCGPHLTGNNCDIYQPY